MSRRLRAVKLVTILAAIILLTGPSESADPSKLSLSGNGTVSLLVGKTSDRTQVRMKAENLSAADNGCKDSPKLEDLGGDGPIKTTVKFITDPPPKKIDQGFNSCAWLWTVEVTDLPTNSTQKRFARLVVGNTEQYVEYTVTNLLLSPLVISVTLPSNPWFIWEGFWEARRAKEIVVKTGDSSVTNFRIAQAALLNNPASWQLGANDLELCETPTDSCGMFSIDARTSRTLYLRLKLGARDHGTYAGTVGFAVNERPEMESLNITVHASSIWAQLAGGLILGFGVVLAWIVGVWARGRILRLEALKPVALLHESIMALRGELEEAPKVEGVDLKHTKQALEDIDKSLTTESLDAANRLPSVIPNPFSRSSDSPANLQQHLDAQGKRVDALMIVIRDGMKSVWQDWMDTLLDNRKEAIRTALKKLDHVSKDVKDRAAAEQEVQQRLGEYRAAIVAAGAQGDARPVRISPPSTQSLIWEIGQIQKWVWIVWGGLTVVGGLAVLILPNMGFGTIYDFIFCFFWGFGLPTTADKLQQIGPSGISSTIGVSLPKAASG